MRCNVGESGAVAMQDLKKAALLVFANKQDVRGALTAAEISQQLGLTRIKDHGWHIQACCALTGQGFVPTSIVVCVQFCVYLPRQPTATLSFCPGLTCLELPQVGPGDLGL